MKSPAISSTTSPVSQRANRYNMKGAILSFPLLNGFCYPGTGSSLDFKIHLSLGKIHDISGQNFSGLDAIT